MLDDAKDEVAGGNHLISFEASLYFDIEKNISQQELVQAFREGKIKMAVVFPQKFKEQLEHTNTAPIQLIADATDPNVANTLVNYASSVILDYQTQMKGVQKVSSSD